VPCRRSPTSVAPGTAICTVSYVIPAAYFRSRTLLC
jgi:hypothetical protein